MIAIASDHGGIELKEAVKRCLDGRGIAFHDFGVFNDDSVDYPDFGALVAGTVSRGEMTQGILICGTGIGMSIVANKFPGVRAALVHDEFTARMAKEHNDANIIVLGGRVLSPEMGCRLVGIWFDAVFEEGRHQKRLDKIALIEKELGQG
ncbi:MAG: ribose 5-phosphate isomerase B [Desulfuromonadaceae bacterium]|nr:ribose 5-phosphate isomerase B [Desulfuromonadaceae bacterium]